MLLILLLLRSTLFDETISFISFENNQELHSQTYRKATKLLSFPVPSVVVCSRTLFSILVMVIKNSTKGWYVSFSNWNFGFFCFTRKMM